MKAPPQQSHSEIIFNRDGTALLITLLFLLLLTILGTSSLYLAFSEALLSRSAESDARAFYTAESGIELARYWFAYPDRFAGPPEDFFRKRMIDGASFFDENGVSQYQGTSESPDLTYPGEEYEVKVYGPTTPGALCTVASTGISGRIRRTVTAEMVAEETGVKIRPGSWRVD